MNEQFVEYVSLINANECTINYGTTEEPLYLLSALLKLNDSKNRPSFSHYSDKEKINKIHKNKKNIKKIYSFLTKKGVERFINEHKKTHCIIGIFNFYNVPKWSDEHLKNEIFNLKFLKFCKDLSKCFPDYKIIGKQKILLTKINITLGTQDSDIIIKKDRLKSSYVFEIIKIIFEFIQKRCKCRNKDS